MAELTIDRSKTALLIMDYQSEIVDSFKAVQEQDMLPRAARVLEAARNAGIPIIYVVVRFRAGYPEVCPRNRGFSALKQAGRLKLGTPGAEPHPEVAPRPGDIVVTKHRIGAFQNTDLATILRARDVDTLVMFGVATSGVVLSTTRYAADADYQLVLLGDLCADSDPEVHRVLMEKVLARQATVATAEDFIKAVAAR